jgi:hypothetical protein
LDWINGSARQGLARIKLLQRWEKIGRRVLPFLLKEFGGGWHIAQNQRRMPWFRNITVGGRAGLFNGSAEPFAQKNTANDQVRRFISLSF